MATSRSLHRSKHRDSASVAGVDTDGNGQFTVTFGDLRRIDAAEDVDAHASGGYVINCVSVSGNTATFEVREGIGGTSAGALPLVTNGAGVTDVHASAVGH